MTQGDLRRGWCVLNVKLPAHRAGLPGEEVAFMLCPSAPPIPLWRDAARSGQFAK